LKTQVGEIIYEYVKTMVPQERAPKITGMLIELPVDQIKAYLVSYDALNQKVQEASDLIDQSEGAAVPQQAPQ
jgi:gentisate 1,2-dioxygenase